MEKIIEMVFMGLTMGSIYAMLALGFVLIFKSTGVLNFAQGEMAMIGAFICYTFASMMKFPYMAAFPIAIVMGGVLGICLYFLFLRRMVGESIFSTIMLTVGLASVLMSGAGLIWGHDVHLLASPFTGKVVNVMGVVLSQGAAYTIILSVVLFLVFILFFNRSVIGISMKGAAEDTDTAGLMGINVKNIHMIAWAIGGIMAALAGMFLAEQSFVHLHMSHVGIKAMAAAILGGMHSIAGAVIGGLIVGIAESVASSFFSGREFANFHTGDVKEVAAFVFMIVVLMIRPQGIFGKEKVERV